MRFIPVAVLVMGAALVAAHGGVGAGGEASPALALFTFAVSAFREPLP